MPQQQRLVASRRAILAGALIVPVLPALARPADTVFSAPDGAVERIIPVQGAKLWSWDSGGKGPPILLLHPATGSAAIWEYQYAAFRDAGYRVIAYSRRGHYRSPVEAGSDPGFSVDDVDAIADAYGLKRFFLLGSAAGGFMVPDYALTRPERLLGIVMACTQGAAADPAFRASITRILPEGFSQMPASFRELGPSYRATNPEGMARWEALEHVATIDGRFRQKPRNILDWPTVSRIAVPTLVIAGGADLYIPPALARIYAGHIPGSRFEVIADSGHSAYWEQPEAFNRAVLRFTNKHKRG
ncbi:alpha/beta fold hydrolase [Sphingomonas sp. AOB5]|uniref:alpha/beta fold hydrolase n=1 Tax=Sphingomonas sp. AOB5 TaxID=3034017 RepID=UPI0023F9EE5C|nr:alpha/beta fold hydrolase [Sphingomonas sp. AOB5]MDF7775566.1 alpha/beta fold hydrolase [Sphingomonas sp. AOB5]